MALVKLNNEEKALVDVIVSMGCVPSRVVIEPTDYLTMQDILDIEDYAASHDDKSSRTFINNKLRDNK